MRLNIQKLMPGGVLFSAAAPIGQPKQVGGSESSSSGSKSDGGLLSDSMMKELMKRGIPTEVDEYFDLQTLLEQKISNGSISQKDINDSRKLLNRIVYYGDSLKKAKDLVSEKGTLDEFAVSQRGGLYIKNKQGQVEEISFRKFNPRTQKALTVGELIYERENNPQLRFRDDVTTSIGQNTSLEQINDYIQKIIKEVGSQSSKEEAYETLAGLVQRPKRPDTAEFQALQQMASALEQGPNAIFKVTQSVKRDNIEHAYNYIMSMLSNNMKRQLEGHYIASGGSYKNSGQYASEIIQTALMSNSNQSSSYELDYQASINKDMSDKQNSGKPKQHSMTMLEQFFNNDLNHTTVKLSDPNYDNKTALEVSGTVMPSLANDKNQAVTNMPLSLAFANEGMGKYLDYGKSYMGYQKISEGMLQDIAYTQGDIANVWMPTDGDGNIDFRKLHNFSDAEKEIKLKGVTNPEEKNRIHAEHGSVVRYNSEGKVIDNGYVEPFLMLHGYTIDDLVDSKNNFTRELTGDEEDQVANVMKAIYKQYKKVLGTSKISGQQSWDDIVQVPVFIRIKDNAALNAATYAGYGSLVDTNTLDTNMKLQDQNNSIIASGQALFME